MALFSGRPHHGKLDFGVSRVMDFLVLLSGDCFLY